MSQMALASEIKFNRWLIVNGAFVVLILSAIIAESAWLLLFVNLLIFLWLFAFLLIFFIEHPKTKMSTFLMVSDGIYDAGILTMLCLLTPWHTWTMYLVISAFSAYRLWKA